MHDAVPLRHAGYRTQPTCTWRCPRCSNRPAACPTLPPAQLGNYTAALADYEAALALDPRSSYAHYNAGIVRDRMGDYAPAVAAFTQAIMLEPQNADFYHVCINMLLLACLLGCAARRLLSKKEGWQKKGQ